jgi:hypothetical protein
MKRRIGFLVGTLVLVLFCSALAFSQQQGTNIQRGPVKMNEAVKLLKPADLAAWEVIGTVGNYNPQTQLFQDLLLVGQVRNVGQLPWTGNRTVTLVQTKNGVTVKTETQTITNLAGGQVLSLQMVVGWDSLNDQSYGCKLIISPGDKNAVNDEYTCKASTPPVIK